MFSFSNYSVYYIIPVYTMKNLTARKIYETAVKSNGRTRIGRLKIQNKREKSGIQMRTAHSPFFIFFKYDLFVDSWGKETIEEA